MPRLLNFRDWDEAKGLLSQFSAQFPFDEIVQLSWSPGGRASSVLGIRRFFRPDLRRIRAFLDTPSSLPPSSSRPKSVEVARPPDLYPETWMKAAVVVVKHRRSLLCRRLHHIDGLKVRNTLRYHFSQCIQHAEKAGWRSRSYKIRFLGILPHLLLVLDAAKNSTHLSKNELKELRSEASGDELNALNDRQTLLKRVYLSAHRSKRR